MLRQARHLAVLATTAAVISACGSSGDDSGSPIERQGAAPKSVPAPTGERLTVTGTDLRLGDATSANPTQLTQLEVPERDPAPSTLRRPKRKPGEGVGAGASCQSVTLQPSGENIAAVAAATLCLVNGERIDRGLLPLEDNPQLARAAAGHSRDMIEQTFFAHQSKDGRDVVDRIRATGYIPASGTWTVGENLAWGTGTLATPEKIVAAWMNSPGHRANILNGEFMEAGQGVLLGNPQGGPLGATYTMNFGAVAGAGTRVTAEQPSSTTRTTTGSPRTTTGSPRTTTRSARKCRRGTRRVRRKGRTVCASRARASRRRPPRPGASRR